MSTLSQFAGGGVKSVQRGTITILSSVNIGTATISSVNVNKTMINFLGLSENSSSTANNYLARIELTNATTITAIRISSSGTTAVSYEVIEFN